MTPQQVKGARAMLGWSLRRLAGETRLSPTTVLSYEAERKVSAASVDAIFTRLGLAGITFTADPVIGLGVHLRKSR